MRLAPKSTTIYDNIRVLNMDGELIFFANQKRAQWYLKRGAAKIVSEDPYTIQFTFRAKGHGKKGDIFYLQEMKNVCVVCGTSEQLTQHHCFPACYRTNLPEDIKSHASHDLLVVCTSCHGKYEGHAYEFRRALSKEFAIPLNGSYEVDQRLGRAVQFSKTLLKHGEKIPEDKKNVMFATVKEYLGKEELSQSDLENLSQVERSRQSVAHGKLMMEKVSDVPTFIKRWREHFIQHAQPKFLPPYWSVDRKEP